MGDVHVQHRVVVLQPGLTPDSGLLRRQRGSLDSRMGAVRSSGQGHSHA